MLTTALTPYYLLLLSLLLLSPSPLLGLVRQRRVTECAEGEGKHVLPRPAGLAQPRLASLPPLAQSLVVELPQALGNDKGHMPVLQAFLEQESIQRK